MVTRCSQCKGKLEKPRVKPSLGYAICQKCKTLRSIEYATKIRRRNGIEKRVYLSP